MEENSRKQQSWNVHIGPHSLTLHLEIQLLTRSVARLLSDPYFTLLDNNYSKLLAEYGWKHFATASLWVWYSNIQELT